jgi:diguanylate cyclase (GGDEF)-like protein/PAS domain S-box-containing protein
MGESLRHSTMGVNNRDFDRATPAGPGKTLLGRGRWRKMPSGRGVLAGLGDSQSESGFREAVMTTIDGILVVDAEGCVHFANPSAERLLGRPADQLLASPFGLPLVTTDNIAELDLVHPDGPQIVIEMHVGSITWDGRDAFVVTLRDVTARKTVERELRASEERFALAAHGANDGLWDWDLVANRLHTSPRWKEIVGLDPADDDEEPSVWLDRVHPDDLPFLQEEIDRHLSEQTDRLTHEHRLRHSDGSYTSVLSRGVAIQHDGRAVRFAGSLTDLTARQELRRKALHDSLTNLANRALFLDHLKAAIARERRSPTGRHVAVLFLDLDRFKLVNDSLGHSAGDALLIEVANRIDNCLRSTDVAARLGGDEFAVLLEVDGFQAALSATLRIQKEIARPIDTETEQLYSTASIGICVSDQRSFDPEQMLRNADIAMYRAKAQGPGNCQIFEDEMQRQALQRLRLHTELRRAVERSEFTLRYQPIIDLADTRIMGFEALLRWQHGVHGTLDAEYFIDAAEETGVIVPLGWRALDTACRQVKEWDGIALPTRVSVNVSNRQFAQSDFADRVQETLAATDVDGSAIQLEITERVMVHDYDMTTAHLNQCHDLGIDILIDDFGTGQSSLTALHRLPVDTVKIDRSFISHLDGTDNGEIVTAILALTRSLGLHVVGEGIETVDQYSRLLDLGCDVGQGFLFEPALEAEEATRLLVKGTL